MKKMKFSELLSEWDITYWGGTKKEPIGEKIGDYIVEPYTLEDFMSLLDICIDEDYEGLVVYHDEAPKRKILVEDDGKTMYVIWEKRHERYYPVQGRFFTKKELKDFLRQSHP